MGRRGGRAHHSGQGVETGVVRCLGCHAVYQFPVLLPSGNPYDAMTAGTYFSGHDQQKKVRAGEAIARRAEEMLGCKGKLLDVGCGRDELLQGARRQGWKVAGVDMTPWTPPDGDSAIEVSSLENARSFEEQYEVVVLAGILEHVYDPAAALARVREALVPGGLVYIDVPNECSLWSYAGRAYMRARGRNWAVNLSPTFSPFHVIGLCPRSLGRLLENTGFDVRRLEQYSLSNRLGNRPGALARLEHLASSAMLGLGHALGMGAGMICWAARR